MDGLLENAGLLVPVLIFASAILVFMFGFKRPEQPKFAKKTDANEYKQQQQQQQQQQKQKKKKVSPTTSSTNTGGGNKTSPAKRKTISDDDDEMIVRTNSNNKKNNILTNSNSLISNNNIKKRESGRPQQNKNNKTKDNADDGSWIVVSKNDKKRQVNQNLILNEMAANLFQNANKVLIADQSSTNNANLLASVVPQSPVKNNKKTNLKTKELKEKANQKQKELEKFNDAINDENVIPIANKTNNTKAKSHENDNTSAAVVDNKTLDDTITGSLDSAPPVIEMLGDKIEPIDLNKKRQLINAPTPISVTTKEIIDIEAAIKKNVSAEKKASNEQAIINEDEDKWTEAKTVKNTKRRARRDV